MPVIFQNYANTSRNQMQCTESVVGPTPMLLFH